MTVEERKSGMRGHNAREVVLASEPVMRIYGLLFIVLNMEKEE